jgi:hypothetical protein
VGWQVKKKINTNVNTVIAYTMFIEGINIHYIVDALNVVNFAHLWLVVIWGCLFSGGALSGAVNKKEGCRRVTGPKKCRTVVSQPPAWSVG